MVNILCTGLFQVLCKSRHHIGYIAVVFALELHTGQLHHIDIFLGDYLVQFAYQSAACQVFQFVHTARGLRPHKPCLFQGFLCCCRWRPGYFVQAYLFQQLRGFFGVRYAVPATSNTDSKIPVPGMQALAAVQFKGRILWIIGIQVGNNPVYVCLGFNQCVAGPCSCRRGRGFKAHVDTLRWDRRVCPVHPLQHIIPGARPQLSGNLIVHVSVYDHTAGAQVHALNLVRVAPYRLPLLRSWVYLVKICKYILGRFSSWRQVPCIGCCRCFRCRLGISGRLVGRQSVPYILAALFGLYRVGQAINELLFVHVVAIGNVLCLGHLQ